MESEEEEVEKPTVEIESEEEEESDVPTTEETDAGSSPTFAQQSRNREFKRTSWVFGA